ncbi:MAG: hypothetical protein R3301_16320, partial [Saprospiraceae bacterium]|nr:hypothetical protein [Saprospiraceae bacterium]
KETAGWIELRDGNITSLHDNDGDTRVQVEESPDEDMIRFDVAGTEVFRISRNANGYTQFANPANGGGTVTFGNEAGLNLAGGQDNAFVGVKAGKFTTTGWNNAFFGHQAGQNNADGDNNSFFGTRAGQLNTTGSNNTAIGHQAGYSNTDGIGNVFIGNFSGYFETGSNKLYIENDSGTDPLIYGEFDNDLLRINGTLNVNNAFSFPTSDGASNQVLKTDGAGNLTWASDIDTDTDDQTIDVLNMNGDTLEISLQDDGQATHKLDLSGVNAVQTIIADEDNDTRVKVEESGDEDKIRFDMGGIEYFVLDSGRIGIFNTGNSVFIGENAGMNDDYTNNRNTVIGDVAFVNNTTGRWNTATGYAAMRQGTTSEKNVANGFAALDKNNGNDNTAIGYLALTQALNANQNVAVGSLAGGNAQGSGNVFVGYHAGRYAQGSNTLYIENSDADSVSALIYGEFDNNWLRVNGRVSPMEGITDADGDTGIKVEESMDDDFIRFGIRGSEVMTIDSAGYVGIGVGDPSALLHVNGEIKVNQKIQAHDAAGLGLATDEGNTRLFIHDNGNVGIGTTNPQAKLHVEGTLEVDQKIQANDFGGLELATQSGTTLLHLLNIGKIKIGADGTPISSIVRTTVIYDIPPIAQDGVHYYNFPVPGASPGSTAYVSTNDDLPGSVFIGQVRVPAADTVKVKFLNENSFVQDPGSMTFYITVINH